MNGSVLELDLDFDAFSGPFDLLLALVLREELELVEVPIVTVVGTGGTTTTTTTTTTTVPATGIPASGATPALAHTGGDVLDLGPLAVLLVLAGAGLVRLGAADSATRRQVLEPSVGRHLAISGRHLRP